MSEPKSTRDIAIELKGMMMQYMEASKDRRKAIDDNFSELKEDRKALESRIHSVEKKVWYASGATGLASALMTFFLNPKH